MTTELKISQKNLYDTDFVRWVDFTVEQLQNQDYASVDWANLIEEIADMSKREQKSLKGNLVVLLLHLLKWHYQPGYRSGSWRGSIREYRRRIKGDLQESPSLHSYLRDTLAKCYQDACAQAADETGLPFDTFPITCPYELESRLLNADFLPDNSLD